MSPRRRTRWVLFVLFVLLPLAELFVAVQVGQRIGAAWTILLLVLGSLAGGWLVRHEGSRAWAALRAAVESGRTPARELADGALLLAGGVLMLVPGFITDLVGILLILPFTRPAFRGLLTRVVAARLIIAPLGPNARRPGPGSDGSVVRGEVVDDS